MKPALQLRGPADHFGDETGSEDCNTIPFNLNATKPNPDDVRFELRGDTVTRANVGSTAQASKVPLRTQSTQRNHRRSPLLRLPAELRNMVYTYAFMSATLNTIVALSRTDSPVYSITFDGVSLHSACRHLRDETYSYHHRITALLLPDDLVRLQDLVRLVGERRCRELGVLTMSVTFVDALLRTKYARWPTQRWHLLDLVQLALPQVARIVIAGGADWTDAWKNEREMALWDVFGRADLVVDFV